jgi:hypothetical protein
MLPSMVARTRRAGTAPDRIERFYAEVKRDTALRRAADLRQAKNTTGARLAAQEAAKWAQRALELLKAEEVQAAKQRRDSFAKTGIELAEAGDIPGARKAAKEAERWDRELKRLARR